jgi:hypothetical protein
MGVIREAGDLLVCRRWKHGTAISICAADCEEEIWR